MISLYRHFDKHDRLLYVGISNSFMARLAQHRGRSHWYWSISRVDVTHYPNRLAAERAEARAIRTEMPLHNKSIPTPRKVRTKPKQLVVPFVGPPSRVVFGYARGHQGEVDSLSAALGASGVKEGLMFVDVIEDSGEDRPSFIRLMKYAQRRGALVFTARRSDFNADARAILAGRGVEVRNCLTELLAMVASEQNAANVRKSRNRV